MDPTEPKSGLGNLCPNCKTPLKADHNIAHRFNFLSCPKCSYSRLDVLSADDVRSFHGVKVSDEERGTSWNNGGFRDCD